MSVEIDAVRSTRALTVLLSTWTLAHPPLRSTTRWRPVGDGDDKGSFTMQILFTDRTINAQASSTRYLLRVVTTVTSFTIVPNSSCSNSACRARAEDCLVPSPSYKGRGPEPRFSENGGEGMNVLSIFTGISFQIRRGRRSVLSSQSQT